jgi:hypothetical protein
MRSLSCSATLLVCFSVQVLLSSRTEADPIFQEVEVPTPSEGVVIRPVEGGIVTIGSTQTIALLPDSKFLPGQFPPPPPDTTIQGSNVTISYADTSPHPPREVPPPSPAPPVLPTTTIALDEIVELGSSMIPTHINNKGHAAVGTFSSISNLSVQGDIILEEGAYLYFDAKGPGQDEQDLIRAYRSLAISGNIRMVFRNGYAPRAGDVVPLVLFSQSISFSSISAQKFEFANLESSPYIGIWINDNIFGIRFYADTIFVPEPSAMLLMTCGILFFFSKVLELNRQTPEGCNPPGVCR